MTHNLVRCVMIAAIVHGNDAKCEEPPSQKDATSKLSVACAPAVSADSGAIPPACAPNTMACGMLMKLEYQYDCVGSDCSQPTLGPFNFGKVHNTSIPQQLCFPTACINDADMATYKNFTQKMMQSSLCQSLSGASSLSVVGSNSGLEASIDTQVRHKDIQMSCDKDAQGQIVIDGTVIPVPTSRCEPCGGADGCGNFNSETECKSASQGCDWHPDACASEPTGSHPTSTPIDYTSGSMSTCREVKRAFKMAGCCGNPTKTFTMPDGMQRRRLSSEEELLESVKAALQNAYEVGGPSKVRSLAKAVNAILPKLD